MISVEKYLTEIVWCWYVHFEYACKTENMLIDEEPRYAIY